MQLQSINATVARSRDPFVSLPSQRRMLIRSSTNALQTGYTPRQIRYALAHCLTPQKQRTGRRVLLNTLQRKKLI
jgi:hypothetical protein